MTERLILAGFGILIALLGYWLGCFIGAARQRAQWTDHMEKGSRYAYAVDDLDRWCGHSSPHARLIARHLRAEGEGEPMNAGTPMADEACTISGLREQLRRLDAKATTSQGEGA
ncbi:MAG: hypothetical protein DI563_19385 [Variovorax paradoxus]|uniref:Uncharacterized protein n=1 Tax=Variovorax paradoxus TaxID=34073 RepID=A0A2W5PXF7_VARPD|nr:MAG: hypothetical protein DI563_19385 [Variovorax paradoxus]